jgi:RNA polymerase sigma-70 factor (ECF subfamily)
MGTRLPDKESGKTPEGVPDDSAALIGGLKNSITGRSSESQARWASLKKKYDPHLLAHARNRIGSELLRVLDPEEIVDEAWIRVFESWAEFQYEKKNALRAWLCLQVDRVIIDRCRRERRRPPEVVIGPSSTTSGSVNLPADASGPATVCAHKDRRDIIMRAIDGLPDIYRRALRAVWLEEKPRDEVAKELNIKPNTLTVQLKRGMELLREKLDPDLV